MSRKQPIEPQKVDAMITSFATFLVLSLRDTDDATKTVRSTLSGLSGLIKSVSFRDLDCRFAVTAGISNNVWDRLINLPKPAELHSFAAIEGKTHTAPSTPGDLLFHIRSERRDINFEFEKLLMDQLDGAVDVIDGTNGFRYFDMRDLLGFIDGTANPVGQALDDSILITEQDDTHAAGGSYIVVQKYLHDMKGWKALPVEQQEATVGRTKMDNIELDDAPDDKQKAHKTLCTIVDEQGQEHDILRDNMPFGSPSSGEYGTYFIGYARKLWVIEKMLQRMFIGDPPGLHDQILNYSRATTGTTFFAPNADVLAGLSPDWKDLKTHVMQYKLGLVKELYEHI